MPKANNTKSKQIALHLMALSGICGGITIKLSYEQTA